MPSGVGDVLADRVRGARLWCGLQWFWYQTGDPVSGSEAWIQNPGGGFGAGTGANPGSSSGFGFGRNDMAFVIEGDVVPAPGALALLGLGGLVAGRRRR